MRMKKTIVSIALTILLVITFIPHNVYAEDLMQNMKDQAISWLDKGKELGNNVLPSTTLQNKFIPIGQVLVTIATIVVLVVTLVMGIKYITANPEEKGKLKQQLIGLVVSIVVIYGAVGIWTLVQNIMNSLDI